MAEFVVNRDMFGRYCRIPTGTSGDMHTYKIVSRIDSNSYCDVPLTSTSKKILHNKIVPVLLVIHCGVDESDVQRVALSDCEIVPTDVSEVKHSEWKCSSVSMKTRNIMCRLCRRTETISNGRNNFDYCPNCGARMDGDWNE